MTKKLSPLRPVDCICPLCHEESKQLKVRDTLVQLKDHDIDLRPKKVLWSPKVEPKVDPKLYFFWQCSVCSFTSDWKFYQAPFEGTSLGANRYKKDLQKALNSDENYTSILSLLSLSEEKSAFIRSVKLNLLAIYLQEALALTRDKECRPLASYYLRYAWLLRDLRSSKAKAEKYKDAFKHILKSLRSVWPQVPIKESDALTRAAETYTRALTGSSFLETSDEIQINLIIARIWMQMEAWGRAFDRIRDARIRSIGLQESIKKQLKSPNSNDGIDKLQASSRWCENLIFEVEKIYDIYRDDAKQKILSFCHKIIEENKGSTTAEIEKILNAQGIQANIVAKVLKPYKDEEAKKSPKKMISSFLKKIS